MKRISIYKGDITQLKVDAIVNAANKSLLGGGGVDGAIHKAAGPELLEICKTLNGCPTGEAKITRGFNLPAKYIIHTVGPVWMGGEKGEAALLYNCYSNALRLAENHQIKSIAFPNISTGIYGFPKTEAAEIAMQAVKNFLDRNRSFEAVIFAIFDDENFRIYQDLYN